MAHNGKKSADFNAVSDVVSKQAGLDTTVNALDVAIEGGLNSLVRWVKRYAFHANDFRLDFQGSLVLDKLSKAGYKADEYTTGLISDKNLFGRLLVGQVMTALEQGSQPNNNLFSKFSEQYLAMPDLDKTSIKPLSTLPI